MKAWLVFVLGVAVGCGSSNPGAPTSCDAQHACSGGLSCQTGEDFPGTGTCIKTCKGASDCPDSASCVPLASGSFCLEKCRSSSECPQSFVCSALTDHGSVCLASQVPIEAKSVCSASPTLVSGGMVGPSTAPSECQRPVVASALPEGQVQHLGQHTVGETLHFTVAPKTASVSIASQRVSSVDTITFDGDLIGNSVVPGRISVGGETIYDDNVVPLDNQTLSPLVYDTVTPSTGVITYPNTSAGLAQVVAKGAPEGSWSFVVNDFAFECAQDPAHCSGGSDGGVYDLTVLTKPGPLPDRGTLDVAIYLVTESGLTSATAPTNVSVRRMVQSLASVYAAAGVCLGTVTVFDVPTWAKLKYADAIDVDEDGPCEDLHQLFTLSQPGNRLNLFFVDALHTGMDRGGGILVGIDGAIPGPSSFGGTPASGAAVTIADLESGHCGSAFQPSACGADEIAFISAHEGGHWLGLYHTSEGEGVRFDPLADTPACICDLCASSDDAAKCADRNGHPDGGPTFVDGQACSHATVACGGGDNLMFWELNARSTGVLTTEQSQVMRANPLVQ